MPLELESNIISGLIGLVIGLAGGSIMRPSLQRGRISRGDVLRGLVGILILGLVIAGYVGQDQAAQRLAAIAICQHQSNLAFSEALAQRGTASHEADVAAGTNAAALQQLLSRVATGAHGPALVQDLTDAQNALATYETALAELDAADARHPLLVKDCSS